MAGLVDSQERIGIDQRANIKALAIEFAAALPSVFGESLDRLTMWDRIGSGLQTGFAKSAGADCEYFVNEVLNHVKASSSKASANQAIGHVLDTLGGWSDVDRQGWLAYFNTHLIPILVHSRAAWEQVKEEQKAKRKPKDDDGTIDSFLSPKEDDE